MQRKKHVEKCRSSLAFHSNPPCHHRSFCIFLQPRGSKHSPQHQHTKRMLTVNFIQNKIRWGCEIKYAKPTVHTESKTTPDIGNITEHKLWYTRRHRPATCPAGDHSLKQLLPSSKRLPGSESLHLPSGLCFYKHKAWVLLHGGLWSPWELLLTTLDVIGAVSVAQLRARGGTSAMWTLALPCCLGQSYRLHTGIGVLIHPLRETSS